MGLVFLAAFIGIPLIEIALFIEVGDAIGLWTTILVVILTAMAGTVLLRHQGLNALARLQDSLNANETPVEPVFDGFCLLVAGLLLLTPGFFTDTVGFLLFVPAVRRFLRRALAHRVQMRANIHMAGTHTGTHPGTHPGASPSAAPGDIIEAEFEDITDQKPDPSQARLKDGDKDSDKSRTPPEHRD